MNAKRSFINDDFRMSYERSANGWTMPYSHYHVSCEIYFLESGERIVTIDDEEYVVQAYDVTLFPSTSVHKSRGTTPFSGICLHFSEKYLDSFFSAAAKKHLMECFRHRVINISSENFEKIKSITDNFTNYASDNFIKLAEILNILNHSASAENVNTASEKKATKSKQIEDYVNENYFYIKQIKELTDMFNVSENYIFQIFRKKYNMTPKQYINSLRIQTACHRLHYSDNSIKAISADCGFESYEYFIRVFKKITGYTPTEYRQKISQNKSASV